MGIGGGVVAQGAGFDRYHFPDFGGKLVGVAAGAGADVAGEAGFGCEVCGGQAAWTSVGFPSVVGYKEGVAVKVVVGGNGHTDSMATLRGIRTFNSDSFASDSLPIDLN